MLILASTTDLIQLQVGSPGTIDVHADWMDNVSGAVGPGRTNTAGLTSGTTTIVSSPASGAIRNIKTLHIYNRGTSNNVVTLIHTDGTTAVQLHSITLVPGTSLQYIDETGFFNTMPGTPGTQKLIAQKVITTPVGTMDFTSEINNSIYNEYALHILGVQINADGWLGLRVSEDGGTTWQADPINQYGHTYQAQTVNNVNAYSGGWDTVLWLGTNIEPTSYDPASIAYLIIHTANLGKSGQRKQFIVDGMMQAGSSASPQGPGRVTIGGTFWHDNALPTAYPPVNGIRIKTMPDGGAALMTAGIFNLYGTRGS